MDLSDDGKWIHVFFEQGNEFYENLTAIRGVSGRKFVPSKNGSEPYWKVKAELSIARDLKKAYGDKFNPSSRMKEWGRNVGQKQRELLNLTSATDAELQRLPDSLPELSRFIDGKNVRDRLGTWWESPTPEGRPYQRADIAFHAKAKRSANFNHPGTGKTFETIAAVFEAGTDEGPNLVVAPKTSVDVVWADTLQRWQPHPVLACLGSRRDREITIAQAADLYWNGDPFWLIVNPAMITFKSEKVLCDWHQECMNSPYPEDKPKAREIKTCDMCVMNEIAPYPEIQDWVWSNLIVDEFHKCGLGNTETATARALKEIDVDDLIIDISGTPLQGKPIKMFSVLQHLRPDIFTSKWAFAHQWLEVDTNGYGTTFHGVRPDREEEFAKMLSEYAVRRTKAEVLPWLPEKQYTNLWVPMEGKQLRVYKQFEQEAEVTIEDSELTAVGILAEYTRLKQFANAVCVIDGYTDEGRPIVKPTKDSNKLPQLLEILEERGITKDGDLAGGEEQVVIFSQFTQFVNLIVEWLREQGIEAEALTGETDQERRGELVRSFQGEGGLRVLVMNTMAGGVSITLDKASTVVFMDETWTPDDQEQAEDRCHRGSRKHQLQVYYLRSKASIEEYIQGTNGEKAVTNQNILDAYREGFRGTKR